MSEITREQVAEALMKARHADQRGINDALGSPWYPTAPADVRDAWDFRHANGYSNLVAALERWLATFPPAKVARWVNDPQPPAMAYRLEPPHDGDYGPVYWTSDRAQAIAWGYVIEGEPEPVHECTGPDCCSVVDMSLVKPAEDSPERLKARREALGLSPEQAAALRASEALDPIDTSGPVTVVAGDGMRLAVNGIVLHDRSSYVAQPGDLVSTVWAPEQPAPAPEVVDVSQPDPPMVKRCDGVEACWHMDEDHVAFYLHEPDSDAVDVPIALLRSMLAAIDAQQSRPAPAAEDRQDRPERPEPRYKVGDWVRSPNGDVWRVANVNRDACTYYDAGYCVWNDEADLAPALDPALHETARKTVAALLSVTSARPLPLPAGYEKLPGYHAWMADHDLGANARWATQLEQLLGDAGT